MDPNIKYGMLIEDYSKHVKNEIVSVVDYGRWIKFSDSYPPLQALTYSSTFIEVLHEGNPYFHSVFHDGKSVFFRDVTMTQDFLEYRLPEYEECYWRFIPEPPGNEGYNCG